MLINTANPAVLLDARTCLWLARYTNLSGARRSIQGTKPAISKELQDILDAAAVFGGLRNQRDESAQPAPKSEWMRTTEASEVADVSAAALRRAIKEERLKATKDDHGWRIRRTDLEKYRAARSA